METQIVDGLGDFHPIGKAITEVEYQINEQGYALFNDVIHKEVV